jgi:hypothetical protein
MSRLLSHSDTLDTRTLLKSVLKTVRYVILLLTMLMIKAMYGPPEAVENFEKISVKFHEIEENIKQEVLNLRKAHFH